MSVVVRTPSNEIRVYSKGAETVILPRLKHYQEDVYGSPPEDLADHEHIKRTEEHINHYATMGKSMSARCHVLSLLLSHFESTGLRTLLVASATLSAGACDKWLRIYRKAALAMHRRKEKVLALGWNGFTLVPVQSFMCLASDRTSCRTYRA